MPDEDADQNVTVTVQQFHRSLYVCIAKRLLNQNDTTIERGDMIKQSITEDGKIIIEPHDD